MIKNSIFLLISATIALNISSCKTKTEEKKIDTYNLNFNFQSGDKFTQKMQTKMLTTTSVMGQQVKMDMKMDQIVDFEMLPSDSNRNLKLTYKKMDVDMEMGSPGMDKKEMSDMTNKLSNFLIGKSFTLVIGKDNQIKDAKGLEEIVASAPEDIKSSIETMFSKDQLNSNFSQLFALYPTKPIKVGDSWTSTYTMINNGMPITINTNYILKDVKNGVALLDLKGDLVGNTSLQQQDLPMEIKMDMKGTQTGKMEVTVDKGMVKSADINIKIDGNMDAMGSKIPMSVEGSTTIRNK